jgi:hypothetical protein
METAPTLRVVGVEGLGGGIFVQFSSGEAVLYSAALLHSVINQAFLLRGNDAGGESLGETESRPRAVQKPN